MAFGAGSTNTKKDFYSIFLVLMNTASASIGTMFTNLKTYLRALPNFLKVTLATGASVTVSNSSGDLVIINDPTTTTVSHAGITDGKVRIVYNLKSSGDITVSGTTVSNGMGIVLNGATKITTSMCGFFPVGACLAEPTWTNEKGDDIKINDGSTLIIGNTTNVSFTTPDLLDDVQRLINRFKTVGIFFLSRFTSQNIYANGLTPFVSLSIKGNNLNQTEFAVTKDLNLTFDSIIEG